MNKIETCILDSYAIREAEKNMVFAARLTQSGHLIHTMADLLTLYEKTFTEDTVKSLGQLPHPTLQKFSVITVAVVGASRRFLSQITRHQNEVKYMSSSLQYSNYTGTADFVIPYELLEAPRDIQRIYLRGCRTALQCYDQLCESGINPDAAGYTMPQGLRNAIIICATPFQWKHMISQRTCRRNSHEMRIVMLLIWQNLYDFSSSLFAPETTGPFCQKEKCLEGKMACGNPIDQILLPGEILRRDYPLLFGGDAI